MKEVTFICLDLETTGLDPNSDSILEIAISLTDDKLNIIDSFESVVWPTKSLSAVLYDMSDYVYEMHTINGLISEVVYGTYAKMHDSPIPTVDSVENTVLDWLSEYDLQHDHFPLMGSSVHFDRAFLKVHMPELEKFFSYKNIDVSSIKHLVKIWNPDDRWSLQKTKAHRALEDVADTLDEASFYYQKFFNRSPDA